MSSKQCCLKWNNHVSSLLSTFEYLRSAEALTDVTLACEGLSVKAHKIVLAACSPYFQSLFLENPCKHPIVMMTDVSYKDLRAILDFMYCGEVNIPQDQLHIILKIAETLKVKGLANINRKSCQASGQNSSMRLSSLDSEQQLQQPVGSVSTSRPHRCKKRRARKMSLTDSSCSDEDVVPVKQKEVEFSEIELSGESADENNFHKSCEQDSNISEKSICLSPVGTISSKRTHSPSNSSSKKLARWKEKVIKVESSEHDSPEIDGVPLVTNGTSPNVVRLNEINCSTSNEDDTVKRNGKSKTVSLPVSHSASSENSITLPSSSSLPDVKPTMLTLEDPSVTLVVETLESLGYDDQLSLPGTSGQVTYSLMQHDGQQEGCSDTASQVGQGSNASGERPITMSDFQAFQEMVLRKIGTMPESLENAKRTIGAIKMAMLPFAERIPEGMPSLPLNSMEKVCEMEKWLITTGHSRVLVNHLSVTGGRDTEDITRRVLYRLLGRKVAIHFNWAGRGEKTAFSNLRLKDVVIEAIMRQSKEKGNHAVIEQAIKSWLKSSKSRVGRWDS